MVGVISEYFCGQIKIYVMKNSDIDNFKNLWKICVTDTHSNSELILTELTHIFFLTILSSDGQYHHTRTFRTDVLK